MIKVIDIKMAIIRARSNQFNVIVSDKVKYDPTLFHPEKHAKAKETISQIQLPKD